MSEIKDVLSLVAKTGGIRLKGKGLQWFNPSLEAKESISVDGLKELVNKEVVLVLNADGEYTEVKHIFGKKVLVLNAGGEYTEIAQVGSSASSEDGNTKEISVDRKYVVSLKGKEFITFNGLLDIAHKRGLKKIETQVVTADFEKSVFVCKAKVTMSDEREFESVGDATATNVGQMVKEHSLRMAETRAIARALRLATNIGMTVREELGEEDGDKTLSKN